MTEEAVGDREGRCSLSGESVGSLGKGVSEHLEFLAAFQRYRGTLERLCLRSGVRLQDIGDVVQETVTVVLDGYVRKQVRSIGGWLFGVLRKQRPRMLIVLKAQGHSPREMAQAVGVSPNGVRCLYLRAIKRMRQHLRPDGHYG